MNLFGFPDINRMAAERDYDGLYRLLEHRDMQVRLQAAQVLAEMEDGAGWRYLLESVRKFDQPDAQIVAAEMLGELGHPRSVSTLGEVLKQSRSGRQPANMELVDAIREALEMIGGADAERFLSEAGYHRTSTAGSALTSMGSSLDADAYLAGYTGPVLPQTDAVQFLSAEQHLNMAVELREAEHAERGLVECSLALWLQPDLAYAWYVRGVLMEDLEREFEALLAYRQALNEDSSLPDAREALQELENSKEFLPLERQLLLSNLDSRDWRERRDAAAGLGELAESAALDSLILHLQDEEREVRHAAVEAVTEIGSQSPEQAAQALPALLEMVESSWLLRFARIEAIAALGDATSLTGVLRQEVARLQERNPVFSSRKDPLLEIEYDRLMEIGVLALERTGDLTGLLDMAEANAWEADSVMSANTDPDNRQAGEDNFDLFDHEEADTEADEDLTAYVDEVAQLASIALERLAIPHLAELDLNTLSRLAVVPDLTLIDLSEGEEQAEPTLVHDLSNLRSAAREEQSRRGGR